MGEHLLNFWRWLQNAAQQAAIAEAPAVMTAAGHKINRSTGKVEYNHQDDKDVKQLRSNLAAIGEAGVTAPDAAKALELGYNIVRHPKQTYKAVKKIIKSTKSSNNPQKLETPPKEIILDTPTTVSQEVAENTKRFKQFADQHRGKIRHIYPNRQYNKFVQLFGNKLDMSQITVDDVYSAMRGRQKLLKSISDPHATYSESGGSFYDEAIKYFDNGELLGELDLLEDGGVGMIESYKPGTGRKLYDAAIEAANQTGRNGIVSGEQLISSPKTFSTWKHYPDKQLIGNYGHWGNKMMKPANRRIKANTIQEAMNADAANLEFSLDNAPVYRLTQPSQYVPVKHTHYFDPEILDVSGNMQIQLSNPSIYKALVPFATSYGLYEAFDQLQNVYNSQDNYYYR